MTEKKLTLEERRARVVNAFTMSVTALVNYVLADLPDDERHLAGLAMERGASIYVHVDTGPPYEIATGLILDGDQPRMKLHTIMVPEVDQGPGVVA